MKSIFRLEEIRSYDSEEHWYRDASIGIVGHYSSLEKVKSKVINIYIITLEYRPPSAFAVAAIRSGERIIAVT